MPKISVIVPVYKVEKYLHECVDSILAQTFSDFELILVDDGSPDNCGKICDEYAAKDARIRVIHQENQGLSGARNAGIDIAQGEFITFIDSDDLVDGRYLEILYSALTQNNADISCCKMRVFQDGESLFSHEPVGTTEPALLSGRKAVLSIYTGTDEVGIFAWGKLYQKTLFKDIRFPLRKLHEDQAVVPVLLYSAKLVASVDIPGYYYRNRSDSITHRAFRANRFDNVEAIDSCIAFFQTQQDSELVSAARKIRKKVNALLVILARSEGANNEIPKKYLLSTARAVYYLYRYAPDNTFSWYMAQLYPNGTRIHAWALKARQILRNSLGKKENKK